MQWRDWSFLEKQKSPQAKIETTWVGGQRKTSLFDIALGKVSFEERFHWAPQIKKQHLSCRFSFIRSISV